MSLLAHWAWEIRRLWVHTHGGIINGGAACICARRHSFCRFLHVLAKFVRGLQRGCKKNAIKGGVSVCLRLSTFARVCLRLLAFSPLRLLAFACVFASAFACVCLRLSAFVSVCLRLLAFAYAPLCCPPLCVTLIFAFLRFLSLPQWPAEKHEFAQNYAPQRKNCLCAIPQESF